MIPNVAIGTPTLRFSAPTIQATIPITIGHGEGNPTEDKNHATVNP
jgi:hypothetical protein